MTSLKEAQTESGVGTAKRVLVAEQPKTESGVGTAKRVLVAEQPRVQREGELDSSDLTKYYERRESKGHEQSTDWRPQLTGG